MIRTALMAAAAGLALPTLAMADPIALNVDPSHTSVRVEWTHNAHTPLLIAFPAFEADVQFDEENIENSSVTWTVDTSALWTGVDLWDEHLHEAGRGLLETATYPTATFASTRVERTGDKTAKLHGDLTIKDQTHPVTFDVEFTGKADGMRGVIYGFLATATVDRAQFGVPMAVEAMGNDVTITVATELNPAN